MRHQRGAQWSVGPLEPPRTNQIFHFCEIEYNKLLGSDFSWNFAKNESNNRGGPFVESVVARTPMKSNPCDYQLKWSSRTNSWFIQNDLSKKLPYFGGIEIYYIFSNVSFLKRLKTLLSWSLESPFSSFECATSTLGSSTLLLRHKTLHLNTNIVNRSHEK